MNRLLLVILSGALFLLIGCAGPKAANGPSGTSAPRPAPPPKAGTPASEELEEVTPPGAQPDTYPTSPTSTTYPTAPSAGTPPSISQGTNMGTGTRPRPAGLGMDEDIVARQLREAAERETDPSVRDSLWKEYNDYQRSP